MNREIRTTGAPAPFSRYAQGVEVPAGARWLHVSGQVGVAADGSLPEGWEEQIELAWRNVFAVLEAAGMGPEDIVDSLVILTSHDGVPVFRGIRDRMLGGHVAGSTMLICGLANPAWKVEIAVQAAKTE
ncbi:RidA family protein [Oceaniglobus roseus]|uniref:RidA family protein n=1 Tax=Oceaniglobus roseus TaxID=1737570 RepID=UPI0012FFFBED|nr:RidA family protein [Kandeliimicrobium roseum]